MKATLSGIGVFVVGSAAAFAQAPQVDHFKCYLPEEATQVQIAPVTLTDQFAPSNTAVGRIFRLCNPTRKIHNGVVTPIQFPDDHLVLHQTGPQMLVPREVRIRNQFGEQVLVTQDAKVLATPTQKAPHGPPQAVNHFSCYAVSNGPMINAPVGLQDQFFFSQHVIWRPVMFCNPTRKVHNNEVTPVTNPNTHLTCYSMTPVPYARVADLRNQFGVHQVLTNRADMACVPTQKLAWRLED